MYIMSQYDRYGKRCAQITDTTGTFMVDQSPLEILDTSIKMIGYDLRAALETSKILLGEVHMRPIMVNPIHRIVLFPTRSPKHEETIWFNPYHIKRTFSFNQKTKIIFNNDTSLVIPVRISAFNTKLQVAEQLEKITRENATEPISLILDPKKRKTNKKK